MDILEELKKLYADTTEDSGHTIRDLIKNLIDKAERAKGNPRRDAPRVNAPKDKE
jgi:hypothetical protein